MKISQASKDTGLSPHTLRYYEKLGFIQPGKNRSGYRDYSPGDISLLNWIACLKKSGMTLDAIRQYVDVDQSAKREAQIKLLNEHLNKLHLQERDIQHYIQVTKEKIQSLQSVTTKGLI